MKRNVIGSALIISIALTLLLLTSCNANAIGSLTNVRGDIVPSSARPGSHVHLVITLTNYENRSLTVYSISLQIYQGIFPEGASVSNSIFSGSEVIPSGGSHDFGVDATLPRNLGSCSVLITVLGILQGDNESSVGLISTSILMDPTIPPSLSDILPIIIVVAAFVIIVLAVVLYVIFRKP